ncbi:hypothetical protein [Phyllobacterium chamaecytisi]|uniref:hypothetical protein n=1 Tax=Phyllobacterium chamaecytisi TaxID=2876082 RepID=UPI001CCE141C|nr:hypothetical protein [Phyllobacterium sp. KW56]MBZ9605712.1 hypothetical protein [Phyllobacterium sp. KW56]
MADEVNWEKRYADLKLESIVVQAVCGFLLAHDATKHGNPDHHLLHVNATLMGIAAKIADEKGGEVLS